MTTTVEVTFLLAQNMNESLDKLHSFQKQPKALQLAYVLERAPVHTLDDGTLTLYLGGTEGADTAATELRRLHAVNRELLEALKLADLMLSGSNMNHRVVETKVRAAIAKATGGAV